MERNPNYYRSGSELLSSWGCKTREEKLERAIICLMGQLNALHLEYKGQSLKGNLDNSNIFCSCADAYRMGHEALRRLP